MSVWAALGLIWLIGGSVIIVLGVIARSWRIISPVSRLRSGSKVRLMPRNNTSGTYVPSTMPMPPDDTCGLISALGDEMTLQFMPVAGPQQFATDPKHPWHNKMLAQRDDIVIFVNDEPITSLNVTVVDAVNGYIKFLRHDTKGHWLVRDSKNAGLRNRIAEGRLKGKVEIFIRTEGKEQS